MNLLASLALKSDSRHPDPEPYPRFAPGKPRQK
jgi:hypothetical protein